MCSALRKAEVSHDFGSNVHLPISFFRSSEPANRKSWNFGPYHYRILFFCLNLNSPCILDLRPRSFWQFVFGFLIGSKLWFVDKRKQPFRDKIIKTPMPDRFWGHIFWVCGRDDFILLPSCFHLQFELQIWREMAHLGQDPRLMPALNIMDTKWIPV